MASFITPTTPLSLPAFFRSHKHLSSHRPAYRRLSTVHRTPPPHPRRYAPVCQTTPSRTTEETFAIDAGRDLFFNAMTAEAAISILEQPLNSLSERDDRFIAAERLKFFPQPRSTQALIAFIRAFGGVKMGDVILEDRVARRKAAESIGRHAGGDTKEMREQSVDLMLQLLHDDDPLMIETAIWSLSEIGVAERDDVLQATAEVLENDQVNSRVVLHTVAKLDYKAAADRVKRLVESSDLTIASAAHTALSMLHGVDEMQFVVQLLQYEKLNVRRAAMEDITIARYVPALAAVVVAPNSIVMKCRCVRVLLERMRAEGKGIDDADTWVRMDRLVWDHPCDLDLLGRKKETKKSRDTAKNIRQLYKNDALDAYLAARTLAEDHRDEETVGAMVKKSYDDLPYFDYFGAYHVYKTLGWLRYDGAYELLLDNAENLPPRFFNHQVGAITALAELGKAEAVPVLQGVAEKTGLWQVQYACMMAIERLGGRFDVGEQTDWMVKQRCGVEVGFGHLRSAF